MNSVRDEHALLPSVALAAQVALRVNEVRQRIEHARVTARGTQSVSVVAVTKTYGVDVVMAAYAAGLPDIGENKVQEAEAKMAIIEEPVRWHLIGHLQRNKARQAVQFDVVHSIDSVRLAKAVNDAALIAEKVQDVLLQVNVSAETSKGGIAPADVAAVADELLTYPHLRVVGVMTMAPFEASTSVLRQVFSGARAVRDALKVAGHPATELSMGMSGDFEIAVEEGATLVRLGTVLFGNRASS